MNFPNGLFSSYFLAAAAGVFLLINPVAVQAGKVDTKADTTEFFSTLIKKQAFPFPAGGSDGHELAVMSACGLVGFGGDSTGRQNKTGPIESIVLDIVWGQITTAVENYDKQFNRGYSAGKNVDVFHIPLHKSKCLAIARMRTTDAGQTSDLLSLVVLQLVRNSKYAFVIRPLYVYTPVLKSRTRRDKAPSATIAISINLKFVSNDQKEVEFKREFSIASYPAGQDAKPYVFSRKKQGDDFGDFDDSQDSGYIPYFGNRPVSITIAVAEAGNGAKTARKLKKLFDSNSAAILAKLKE